MTTDWKDALNSLRNSGTFPVDDSPVENIDDKATKSSHTVILHVLTDRKGRKGKTATIIEGFDPDDKTIADVARTLKQKLATGGSVSGGEILIQGDRKDQVIRILSDMGYRLKK